MNVDKEQFDGIEHPYERATFFQRWTFWWLNDLFKLGMQKPLSARDIYKNLKENDAAALAQRFDAEWTAEKSHGAKRKPHIFNVIWRVCISKVIGFSFLYSLLDILLKITQCQCLGGLVTYFSEAHAESDEIGLWYGAGLIACAFVSSSITSPFLMYTFQQGLQLRAAFSAMIYNKAINMRKSSPIGSSNGKVINLLSFDVYRFDTVISLMHHLWKGPIEVIVFSFFLYNEMGYYGWIGVAFIICFVPIQITMGKMTATYRFRAVKHSDNRVRILNEIVQGIQTIKMYAWELPFMKIIGKIRRKELRAIRAIFVIRGILCSFSIISRFSIFLTLVVYICCGHVFTPRQVFVVTSCFNFLYDSMLYYWTVAMTTISECYVSMQRIQEFLLLPDERESPKPQLINYAFAPDILSAKAFISKVRPSKSININDKAREPRIQFHQVTTKWNTKSPFSLSDLNFDVHGSQLVAIVGPVAAGKSSILHIILRELEIDSGEITIDGKISYSSQEPWLFDATVRQNILFGEPFDGERYRTVIDVCSLEPDFQLLPAGDLTFAGESGICLSGGQKSRINLARAIYRRANIYLLDDPLSAVDAAVAKHIFNRCIKGFLCNKLCILVTHQEQFIGDANRIIYLRDGKIQLNELQSKSKSRKEGGKDEEIPWNDTEKLIQNASKRNGAFTEQLKSRQEFQSIGSVDKSIYMSYLKSVDSFILVTTVIVLFVSGQIAISATDLIVSKWVNWEIELTVPNSTSEIEPSSNRTNSTDSFLNNEEIQMQRNRYVYIYVGLIVTVLYLVFQRALALYLFCLRAARRIHKKLLHSVIHAKMYFFNVNPSGRIVNRFTKDLYDVDYYLALVLYDLTLFCLQAAMSLILVSITHFWVMIATIGMSLVFYRLRCIYVSTARCLRRIEALGRSAIMSHTNATISGSSTIRASNSQQMLIREYNMLLNRNTSVCFIFKASTRAIAFWLELICVLYMSIAISIFFAFETQVTGGNVGLAISQILSLISLSQWGVRQTAELENNMTSVERIMEYVNLDSEQNPSQAQSKLPDSWPTNGSIEFNNVSLKYTEKGDYDLKSVNFKIKAGEKIAICGRTGAGKSSIVKALFRMSYNRGVINIDSVDISNIPLRDLRQKISIIPQDAYLFSGTMRQNLDPLGERSDDELWTVLEKVKLKEIISGLPNGLDDQILDSNRNFSAGQRALVCLARAILEQNKILIQDEATAYLDAKSDALLHEIIRKQFANCTVLTIAHRLHLMMDSDRVLVMDAGQMVEFDHAHILLQKSDGFLSKLVNETGPENARQFQEMARQNYEQKLKML